jgi:hypothetical protein
MRDLILAADPAITEERKWKKPSNGMRGVPVWSHGGIVCTGETYKSVVKLTFAQGAALPDPSGLFNASLEGGTRRAIDIREGEAVDARAFKALVKAAVAHNVSRPKRTTRAKVRLLSGDNPQIPKGDGDAPVQSFIAAIPGWKREAARALDTLVERTVPGVRKAVKWNSPFYGVEGQGWFLSFHCFTKYIKVAFFRGASLEPMPPEASKDKNTRYLHIHEGDRMDEQRVARWIRQASRLPGWMS